MTRPLDVAVGVALLLWWLPTLAVGLVLAAPHLAALVGVPYRLRRVGRLNCAGRFNEAERVLAALQRDCEAARRRWRAGAKA